MKFSDNPAVDIILNHRFYTTGSGDCCLVEGITSPMTEHEHAEHVVALIEALDLPSDGEPFEVVVERLDGSRGIAFCKTKKTAVMYQQGWDQCLFSVRRDLAATSRDGL